MGVGVGDVESKGGDLAKVGVPLSNDKIYEHTFGKSSEKVMVIDPLPREKK